MNDGLYNKQIECPVCNKKFNITKTKMKALRIEKRDADFCIHYKTINPLFYEAIVCENCGYASLADKFDEITYKEIDVLLEQLAPKWTKRSFSGGRTVDDALEAFKLVLITDQIKGSKSSELAKVCMRIAWLYRFKNDKRELDFLRFAEHHYDETYTNERFPADKLDESTCMFMLGELNRRLGNYETSVKWFSKLISSPEARKNAVLMEAARDQFQLVKEMM